MIEFIFIAYTLTILTLAIIGFFYHLRQDSQNQKAKRYNTIVRFNSDELGNKPSYFNPRSGQVFEPAPGNKAFPLPTQNVLIASSGEIKKIPRGEHERPLALNYGANQLFLSQNKPFRAQAASIETETAEAGETVAFEAERPAFQAETGETFLDQGALLRAAKQKGRAKREAIPAVTGVKPGGSKAWADWSRIWDQL